MKFKQQSVGKEKAVALFNSNWWEGKSHRDIAEFQMLTSELCVPFDKFHEAMEKAVGRPIWTHEFGLNIDGLYDELFNGKAAPTFEQILDLIPEEKRVVITV